MKRLLFAAVLLAATAAPALATDVGISLRIGQPAIYGRVDIGGYPPPRVIYRQPMVVERVPVYVVQNGWYQREYVPRHHRHQAHPYRRDDHRHGYREHRRNDHRNY